MSKTVVETRYKVWYPHAGFPSSSGGSYKSLEKAAASIEEYTGPEGIKNAAYITKYETTAENVPRP